MNTKKKLIVLVGPTASGKTLAAIQLAKIFNLEIVSADSRYLYKGMDIGTAKPTQDEIAEIPHHLIDVTDLAHIYSLALFKERASQTIDEIHTKGKFPVLVGGTGQYIKAITEGWEIPPQKPDVKLRDVLQNLSNDVGPGKLHSFLAILDPEAADNIDYQNTRRTVRALEVILKTGRRFSEQRTKTSSPYEIIMIGIDYPRELLYQRIDCRIDQMLSNGLIYEVQNLLEQGYEQSLRNLAAIGYVEIIDFLKGKCTLDEAVMLIKRKTRVFVRRQANWFKRSDTNIRWFSPSEDMIQQMSNYLQECGFNIK